jgi:uncharacterized membrane protein YphA (DoxX/SURF4 family)
MTASSKLRVPARLLLGLIFFTFGLNGFLHFLPQPPSPAPAAAFGGALAATGYMFPLIKGTEVITGLLLLSGRFVPLALTLLAPVVVNIVAFHLFLAPAGLALPFVVLALGLYLAWTEREAYAPLFVARRAATSERQPRVGGHAGSIA